MRNPADSDIPLTALPPLIAAPTPVAQTGQSGDPPIPFCLPSVTEDALGLKKQHNGYYVFSPIKRGEDRKVDWFAIDDARAHWKQDTLTEEEFEHEKELARIWNWGVPSNTDETPVTAASYFKSKPIPVPLLIDYSLYNDLESCLYDCRFIPEESSPLFIALHKEANRFIFSVILRMEERNVYNFRPTAHVIADIIACVSFVRERVALGNKRQCHYSKEWDKISKRREEFWHKKLAAVSSSWTTTYWKEYWKFLSPQLNIIWNETRNLLLLDPQSELAGCFPRRSPPLPDDKPRLSANHSLVRRVLPETLRGDLYKSAGIKPAEIYDENTSLRGSLSDINDRDLYSGPFSLALTTDPTLHLRFDKKNPNTILVLDSRTVCMLAILDLTGLMKSLGLPTYMTELLASQSLIFGTQKSKVIVKRIKETNRDQKYIKDIDLDMLRDFSESCSEPSLQLADFPIFGTRLQHIHQRMVDWRPLRVSELWKRPYRDPLPYFGFLFAVFIGVVGFIGMLLNMVQAVFSILSWMNH